MKEEKLGQQPAFPFVEEQIGNYGEKYDVITSGMSKRFYAACAAMSGIMANQSAEPTIDTHFKNIAEDAYRMADELLRQENQ